MSDLSAMQSSSPTLPPPDTPPPTSLPPLSQILSAHDFTLVAEKALSAKAWAFYSSAATDLVTLAKNKELVRRVMLRPRILRNVKTVNIERDVLGFKSSAPFFVCPMAMATLAHPEGETGWSKAVANEGIFQIISSNASLSLPTILSSAPTHPFFLQLYVNTARTKTTHLLRSAHALGIRAIFLTVDAPIPGKREADERIPQPAVIRSGMSGSESSSDAKGSGLGRLMGTYIDKSLCWDDLDWIRRESSVPVVLKGVQTVEDVRMAVEKGVDGVMLSNHGGRSLDGAQASILILLELRKNFPQAFQHLQVFIDGGFERGSDILKAIALGATAVGIGRPFLYSLVYGQSGVEHLSKILKDELETSMRLAGLTCLDQATPALVNTLDVNYLVSTVEGDAASCPASRTREAKL